MSDRKLQKAKVSQAVRKILICLEMYLHSWHGSIGHMSNPLFGSVEIQYSRDTIIITKFKSFP
jgi:hypothetical protein